MRAAVPSPTGAAHLFTLVPFEHPNELVVKFLLNRTAVGGAAVSTVGDLPGRQWAMPSGRQAGEPEQAARAATAANESTSPHNPDRAVVHVMWVIFWDISLGSSRWSREGSVTPRCAYWTCV